VSLGKWLLLGLLDPEDEGNMIIQNTGICSCNNTALYSRRLGYSSTPLWKPQISQVLSVWICKDTLNWTAVECFSVLLLKRHGRWGLLYCLSKIGYFFFNRCFPNMVIGRISCSCLLL